MSRFDSFLNIGYDKIIYTKHKRGLLNQKGYTCVLLKRVITFKIKP